MVQPSIQYARTEDGVNIAYWTLGDGPPLLMVNLPTMSHVQLEWEVASLRRFYLGLAERFRLIRFSTRNAGLSDRNVEHLRLEDYVQDVEAVLGACTDGAVAILAYGAASIAIQYAADLPDRVSALVVVDGQATYPSQLRNVVTTIANDVPEFAAANVANIYDPGGSDPGSFARLVTESVDADDRPRMLGEMWATWDVTDVMSGVKTPTLICYSPRPVWEALEKDARIMALKLPNSRLLVRKFEPGSLAETLSDEVVSLVVDFIDDVTGDAEDTAATDVREPHGAFRTILFTDLESSTALTQKLGDDKAQEILHGHNDAVRSALAAHGGEEVKHTGDGIMASFGSAVSAVQAALQIQRDLAASEIRVRIGINAGEPIAEDHDYFGTAVQLAARLCDRAEPGQVLVSNVVRELCAGKTFTFEDVGAATLKGFDEPVALYAVGVS